MRMKVLRHALVGVIAVFAGVTAAAVADPAGEKNDTIASAYGPMADGVTYDGVFEDRGDTNDPEFFKFVPSGQSVTITLANTTQGCQSDCPIGLRVLDGSGELYGAGSDTYRPRVPVGESTTVVTYGMTAGQTYYIEVTGSSTGSTYGVSASGVTGSPENPATTNSTPTTTAQTTTTEQPPGDCATLAAGLAAIDRERDGLDRAYVAALVKAKRSGRKADREAAKAMRDKLQNVLTRLSVQIRELLKASCVCELIQRELKRSTRTLASLKAQHRTAARRARTRAQRRSVARLGSKIRITQKAIGIYVNGLAARKCPAASAARK